MGLSSRLGGRALRASGGCVSGSRPMTKTRLAIAKAVAAKAGRIKLISVNRLPRKGPSMNPNPKATPIRPNAFARFSGVEISASTAVALAIVPPLAPSMILFQLR